MKKELEEVFHKAQESQNKRLVAEAETPQGKSALNRLTYYLRRLPQEQRANLAEFVQTNTDETLLYLIDKVYYALTASHSCHYQSIENQTIGGLPGIPPELSQYPDNAPFWYKNAGCKTKTTPFGEITTIAPKTSRDFYKKVAYATQLLRAISPEKQKDFFDRVLAPDTHTETMAKGLRRGVWGTMFHIKHIVAWGKYLIDNPTHMLDRTK